MTHHYPQNPLFLPATDGPLLIGARGWRHAGWRGGFYPDDLPAEWRLGFYANEFRTVLLPPREWRAPGEAAAWVEEVDEGFRFLLESDGASAAELAAAGDALGGRLGGWIESTALWRPGGGGAPAAVGLIPAGPHGPRALRAMLEAFAAQAPATRRYLFLDGAPPDGETLRSLLTLRDLMGI